MSASEIVNKVWNYVHVLRDDGVVHKRWESKKMERWKSYTYDDLIARDNTNLDIFWLRDESLDDTENLQPPEVLAQEIVEQLEAALPEFKAVEIPLNGND